MVTSIVTNGPVDDQQHHDDDGDRHALNGFHAGVADDVLIGGQSPRAR